MCICLWLALRFLAFGMRPSPAVSFLKCAAMSHIAGSSCVFVIMFKKGVVVSLQTG